jgi:putative hydroxymethylpyrimidine transport system ATP-binding protein
MTSGVFLTVGLRIKNASLSYRGKTIFSHLNLSVHAGKWVALLGPKEVGKTAFLRMIAGATTADEVVYYQQSSDNNLPILEQCTLITQNDQLRPWLTLLDNLLICLEFANYSDEEIQEKTDLATALLNSIGLGEMKNAFPYDLSPYMRHRLALLRAVIDNNPIILMDEPFAL